MLLKSCNGGKLAMTALKNFCVLKVQGRGGAIFSFLCFTHCFCPFIPKKTVTGVCFNDADYFIYVTLVALSCICQGRQSLFQLSTAFNYITSCLLNRVSYLNIFNAELTNSIVISMSLIASSATSCKQIIICFGRAMIPFAVSGILVSSFVASSF